MENLAHALCGWRIADLGFRARVGPRAGLIAVIAANLPDADLLLYPFDADLTLWHHRGWTHSFFGWPFLAALGAVVSHRWTAHGRWRDHLGLWAACLLSHTLLDWPTTWGTQLFWPLTDTRHSLEWVFIVDPMFWVLLGLGPRLLGWSARAALLTLAGWILLCGMVKGEVTRRTGAQVVVPGPLAPLDWTGIEDDGTTVTRWFLHPWGGVPAGTFAPARGPAVEALRATHVGERTLWMAIAPVLRDAAPVDGGWRVTISDLAYTSWAAPDNAGFTRTFTIRDGRIEEAGRSW